MTTPSIWNCKAPVSASATMKSFPLRERCLTTSIVRCLPVTWSLPNSAHPGVTGVWALQQDSCDSLPCRVTRSLFLVEQIRRALRISGCCWAKLGLVRQSKFTPLRLCGSANTVRGHAFAQKSPRVSFIVTFMCIRCPLLVFLIVSIVTRAFVNGHVSQRISTCRSVSCVPQPADAS
jgi:hypothetical protein